MSKFITRFFIFQCAALHAANAAFVVVEPSSLFPTSSVSSSSLSSYRHTHHRRTRGRFLLSQSTALFYKNLPEEEDGTNHYPISGGGEPTQNNNNQERVLSIPVLGPIPELQPLFVGAEMILSNPTVVQWKTIEKCIENHQQFVIEQQQTAFSMTTPTTTGIEAAPLVAIIDDITSKSSSSSPDNIHEGRYATLAAVVGITTTSLTDQNNVEEREIKYEEDKQTFMELIQRIQASYACETQSLLNIKVRFHGIGRAALTKFYHLFPQDQKVQEVVSDQDILQQEREAAIMHPNALPIVTAEFQVTVDSNDRMKTFIGARHDDEDEDCTVPENVLYEMEYLSKQVSRLHNDRQAIVRHLKSLKTQLILTKGEQVAHEIFEDLENLDTLTKFSYKKDNHMDELQQRQQIQQMAKKIRQEEDMEVQYNDYQEFNKHPSSSQEEQPSPYGVGEPSQNLLETDLWKFYERENFGMGYANEAVLSIEQITANLKQVLQPYYSPQRQLSKEYHYEVLSFSTMLSLLKYLDGPHLEWGLKCTNTLQRLQQAYDYMLIHKQQLSDAMHRITQEINNNNQ